ncbi:hypothetical protein MBLNU459_g2922t1 [Dothideomycetes sp. NU459]
MASDHAPREMPPPAAEQEKLQPTFGFIPSHHLFAAVAVLLLALFKWPLRWLLSGAPLLTYSILTGASNGCRILPFVNLWTLILFINLTYSVAATSWLLYWGYAGACYPAIFLSCLFQFDNVARFVRKRLRTLLRELQFANDKIAFFDLPALEIDVDVEGLMCIRGLTISLSSLTIVAHGVEVGIKFSDDMELALATDKVTIRLFRRIDIEDVYGNVKGGEFEMTFGKLAKKTHTAEGEPVMVTDTPLLAAAAANGDTSGVGKVTMTEKMTGGATTKDSTVKNGLQSVKQLSPDDEEANKKYHSILEYIDETSVITVSRKEAEEAIRDRGDMDNLENDKDLRAAICSQLHDKPSIPHPAKRSIKVSTIQHLSPPNVRAFLHRLPMLLRALLVPISYFHPVYISSITAGGSGRWIQYMLSEMVFNAESDKGIRNLKQRISAWLADANFVFEAVNITGLASVPFNTQYDIVSHLTFDDIMAYRTLPKEVDLQQIVRVGGADARISLPSFLLPHHEHLLPPRPTKEDTDEMKRNVEEADGQPKTLQMQAELEQTLKDETNINISTHVRLPACFDQSLLDFVAALIKATKIIEIEKDPESPVDKGVEVTAEKVVEKHTFKNLTKSLTQDFKDSVRKGHHRKDSESDIESIDEREGQRHTIKQFTKTLTQDMKDGMRRVALDAAVNDKWIAKLVGAITKKLETMQGDIGYSGDMPVPLAVYRQNAESATKLMA